MFWVLKRTILLRRFFWVPTTNVLAENCFCFFGRYTLLTKGPIWNIFFFTLRLLITTKYCLLYRLPVHLKVICSKQCGPRSDCSFSLVWLHTVCLYAEISQWRKHLHTVDDFSRQHFQMHFFFVPGEGLNLFYQELSRLISCDRGHFTKC